MSTKEEIFEYVTETPENTNPAVLRSMLNELSGGGGGGGSGGGVLAVTDTNGTLDKTWAEIEAAFKDGITVLVEAERESGSHVVITCYRVLSLIKAETGGVMDAGQMTVYSCEDNAGLDYAVSAATDYPTIS